MAARASDRPCCGGRGGGAAGVGAGRRERRRTGTGRDAYRCASSGAPVRSRPHRRPPSRRCSTPRREAPRTSACGGRSSSRRTRVTRTRSRRRLWRRTRAGRWRRAFCKMGSTPSTTPASWQGCRTTSRWTRRTSIALSTAPCCSRWASSPTRSPSRRTWPRTSTTSRTRRRAPATSAGAIRRWRPSTRAVWTTATRPTSTAWDTVAGCSIRRCGRPAWATRTHAPTRSSSTGAGRAPSATAPSSGRARGCSPPRCSPRVRPGPSP